MAKSKGRITSLEDAERLASLPADHPDRNDASIDEANKQARARSRAAKAAGAHQKLSTANENNQTVSDQAFPGNGLNQSQTITQTRNTTMTNATNDEMEFELDVEALKPRDFTGEWHDASIAGVRPSVSAKGNKVLNVQLKIDESDPNFGKRTVWDAITFSDDTGWKVSQFFEAIGQGNFKGTLRPSELVGERVRIKVGMETRTGIDANTQEPYEPRARVQRYAPAGSGGGDINSLIG